MLINFKTNYFLAKAKQSFSYATIREQFKMQSPTFPLSYLARYKKIKRIRATFQLMKFPS